MEVGSSSDNSESCHGSTIYTIITVMNGVKDQLNGANIVVLSGKVCPVIAARVIPIHGQQDNCISFPFSRLQTKSG